MLNSMFNAQSKGANMEEYKMLSMEEYKRRNTRCKMQGIQDASMEEYKMLSFQLGY